MNEKWCGNTRTHSEHTYVVGGQTWKCPGFWAVTVQWCPVTWGSNCPVNPGAHQCSTGEKEHSGNHVCLCGVSA